MKLCNVYLRNLMEYWHCYWCTQIKGLGQPHNEPEFLFCKKFLSNMLCLCPNHHAQFDDLAFYIDPENYCSYLIVVVPMDKLLKIGIQSWWNHLKFKIKKL